MDSSTTVISSPALQLKNSGGRSRLALESVQERANRTMDIWALIVQFCDPSTLSSLARVKREWEDLALRPLWRTTPSLVPLFKTLGEMMRSRKGDGPWVRSKVVSIHFAHSDSLRFSRDFPKHLVMHTGLALQSCHPSSVNQAWSAPNRLVRRTRSLPPLCATSTSSAGLQRQICFLT